MNWTEWLGLNSDPEADKLIEAVLAAHRTAALNNDNVSSAALCLAAQAGTSLPQALSSALGTLGVHHGPVAEARIAIFATDAEEISSLLEEGKKIAGFGNSFFKDSIDPAWESVDRIIRKNYPKHAERLDLVTELIAQCKSQKLFPNAAAYTAVTAHIVNMTPGLEVILLILGRLPAWGMQYNSRFEP